MLAWLHGRTAGYGHPSHIFFCINSIYIYFLFDIISKMDSQEEGDEYFGEGEDSEERLQDHRSRRMRNEEGINADDNNVEWLHGRRRQEDDRTSLHQTVPRCVGCLLARSRCSFCKWRCVCSDEPFLSRQSFRNHLIWGDGLMSR